MRLAAGLLDGFVRQSTATDIHCRGSPGRHRRRNVVLLCVCSNLHRKQPERGTGTAAAVCPGRTGEGAGRTGRTRSQAGHRRGRAATTPTPRREVRVRSPRQSRRGFPVRAWVICWVRAGNGMARTSGCSSGGLVALFGGFRIFRGALRRW